MALGCRSTRLGWRLARFFFQFFLHWNPRSGTVWLWLANGIPSATLHAQEVSRERNSRTHESSDTRDEEIQRDLCSRGLAQCRERNAQIMRVGARMCKHLQACTHTTGHLPQRFKARTTFATELRKEAVASHQMDQRLAEEH